MKKFLTVASLALLTVLLALTLAGCGGVGKLQKAYEKEGYTCTVVKATDNEDIKKEIADLEEEIKTLEGEDKAAAQKSLDILKKSEVLTVKKNRSVALILYTPKLKSTMGDEAYAKAEEDGTVKGDYTFYGLPAGDAYEIFKANA